MPRIFASLISDPVRRVIDVTVQTCRLRLTDCLRNPGLRLPPMAFLPISFLACLLEPGVVERPLPAWSANSPHRPLSPAHVGSLGPISSLLWAQWDKGAL